MSGKTTVGRKTNSVKPTVKKKRGGGNIYTKATDIITDIFDLMGAKTPREKLEVELYKIEATHAFSKAYRSAKMAVATLRKEAKTA